MHRLPLSVAALAAFFVPILAAEAQASEPIPKINVVMPYALFAGQGACTHTFYVNYAGAAELGRITGLVLHIVGYEKLMNQRETRVAETDLRVPPYDASRGTSTQTVTWEGPCVTRFAITRATAHISPDGVAPQRGDRPMDMMPLLTHESMGVPVSSRRR
ncbi:hypothetical protein ACLF3G_26700 [Falsiroseomonas sp. HC035]|uniref:hypothetical protein n=1 Tax=Falsiroseomonas sp. HC035 TaxID=3390999 RepID=UPI003D3145CF